MAAAWPASAPAGLRGSWRRLGSAPALGLLPDCSRATRTPSVHPPSLQRSLDTGAACPAAAAAAAGRNPAIVVGNAQPDLLQWVAQRRSEEPGAEGRLLVTGAHEARGILEGLQRLGLK